jgi:hypothetical protein
MDISSMEAFLIENNISRIYQLLDSNIFSFEGQRNIFLESAFIEILILLRNLMFMSSKYSVRISFTDDINTTETIKDIDSLVKYVRDALCHPESRNNFISDTNSIATFNVLFGKASYIIRDVVYKNVYDDDICFYFGEHGIYLKRHIIRALKESISNLLPLVQQSKGEIQF